MADNSFPQDMLSGTKPKSLGRRLVDMVLGRNKTLKSPTVERSASPAPEVKPEEYLAIQNLVATLKSVDFCMQKGSGVRGRQLDGMMRSWEESDKKFALGRLEDAWYALQPREVGCRPRFMIRNDRETYPHVWHRPSVIRVQRCFYGKKEHNDADGITCYQLGTIWTSSRPTSWETIPPDPSGGSFLSYWRRTPFKLMVEMKKGSEGGEEGVSTGSPTGAVWVVNDSGYHRERVDKLAKRELETVLMARVADSLGDLVDCGRRERWPKFEKADADYLDYFPCYQKEKGGPIVWKYAPDDECY